MERLPAPVIMHLELPGPPGHALDLPPPDTSSTSPDSEAILAAKSKRAVVSRTIGGVAAKSMSVGGRKRVVRVRTDGKKVAFPARKHERLPASEVVKEQRGRYNRSIGKSSVSPEKASNSRKLDPEQIDTSRRLEQPRMLTRRAMGTDEA